MRKLIIFATIIIFLTSCDQGKNSALQNILQLRLTECQMLFDGFEPPSLKSNIYIGNTIEDVQEREMVRRICTR